MEGENVMPVGGRVETPDPPGMDTPPMKEISWKFASARKMPTLEAVYPGHCLNRVNEMFVVPPGWITLGLSVPAVKTSVLGNNLPRYVERDLARYLECGVLAHGFARVRCESCQDELLVPPVWWTASAGCF
jgi:hypothetical protein